MGKMARPMIGAYAAALAAAPAAARASGGGAGGADGEAGLTVYDAAYDALEEGAQQPDKLSRLDGDPAGAVAVAMVDNPCEGVCLVEARASQAEAQAYHAVTAPPLSARACSLHAVAPCPLKHAIAPAL